MLEYKEYILNLYNNKTKLMPSGCIEWHGTINQSGYGVLFLPTRTSTSAHRAIYMAWYDRELNKNQQVCHTCDNRKCVAPGHLWHGTAWDNQQDVIKKGRRGKHQRLHTRIRVVSNDIVLAVKLSTGPLKEVADKYGISVSYASRLRNNKAKTLIV